MCEKANIESSIHSSKLLLRNITVVGGYLHLTAGRMLRDFNLWYDGEGFFSVLHFVIFF